MSDFNSSCLHGKKDLDNNVGNEDINVVVSIFRKNKSKVPFFLGISSIQPTDKGKPKGHTKIIFKMGGYKFEYNKECIIYLRLRRLE